MSIFIVIAMVQIAGGQAGVPPRDEPPKLDQKIVCRSSIPTGSHFSKKICHTKADWLAIDQEGAKAAMRFNNGGRTNSFMNPIHHDY